MNSQYMKSLLLLGAPLFTEVWQHNPLSISIAIFHEGVLQFYLQWLQFAGMIVKMDKMLSALGSHPHNQRNL